MDRLCNVLHKSLVGSACGYMASLNRVNGHMYVSVEVNVTLLISSDLCNISDKQICFFTLP